MWTSTTSEAPIVAEGHNAEQRAELLVADEVEAWRAHADAAGDERADVVRALKGRLDRAVRSAPREALSLADVLERAAAGQAPLEALALRGRASALHFNGDSARACELLADAARRYEELDDELEAAQTRRSRVEVLQVVGRIEEALADADRARVVFERRAETQGLARLEVNVGNLHLSRDEYPAARTHYERARAGFSALDDAFGLAVVQYNLAVVEMNANRLDAAEAAWRGARDAFAAAKLTIPVADCDYSLAYLEARRGRFGPALAGLHRARAVYAEAGKPSGVPLCELDLAETYLRLDALHDARMHADSAVEGFRRLGMENEIARSETLRGLCLARLGRAAAASRHFEEAARRFRALDNETAAAALDIQRAFLDTERARPELLRAARATILERELSVLADLATLALARTLLAAGDTEACLGELGGLRAKDGGDPLDVLLTIEAHVLTAEAQERRGATDLAEAALRAAVGITDQVYETLPGRDVRMAFFAERHAPYVELCRLLCRTLDPAHVEEAFYVLERSRSRSLAERDARAATHGSAYREERERLDWLLARRLDAAFGAPDDGHDVRHVSGGDEELAGAQAAVARLARNDAARDTVSLPEFGARELARAHGGGDALIAYVLSRGVAQAFVATQEGLSVVPLDIDRDRLFDLRDRLWLHLEQCHYSGDDRERRLRALRPILAELGERLVEPLLDTVGARPLVVIPFGPLHGLPLHAFDVAGRPVIEHAEVSYALDASSLANVRGAPASAGPLLACGVPAPGLVELERELGALASLFGQRLRRIAPTELHTLLARGELSAGALHLATHGLFQADQPGFSGVSLGERFLLAHDLAEARLDVGLVTLSGCETARSARIGGEELVGLTRALVRAGARSVIGSLWSIADSDARQLMERFYTHLAAGLSARSALAAAQRQLLREAPHPYSWAGFSLTGDPDLRLPSPLPDFTS